MSIRDVMPRRRESALPTRRPQSDALDQFHRDVDRMFAGFLEDMGFGLPARWGWGSR